MIAAQSIGHSRGRAGRRTRRCQSAGGGRRRQNCRAESSRQPYRPETRRTWIGGSWTGWIWDPEKPGEDLSEQRVPRSIRVFEVRRRSIGWVLSRSSRHHGDSIHHGAIIGDHNRNCGGVVEAGALGFIRPRERGFGLPHCALGMDSRTRIDRLVADRAAKPGGNGSMEVLGIHPRPSGGVGGG